MSLRGSAAYLPILIAVLATDLARKDAMSVDASEVPPGSEESRQQNGAVTLDDAPRLVSPPVVGNVRRCMKGSVVRDPTSGQRGRDVDDLHTRSVTDQIDRRNRLQELPRFFHPRCHHQTNQGKDPGDTEQIRNDPFAEDAAPFTPGSMPCAVNEPKPDHQANSDQRQKERFLISVLLGNILPTEKCRDRCAHHDRCGDAPLRRIGQRSNPGNVRQHRQESVNGQTGDHPDHDPDRDHPNRRRPSRQPLGNLSNNQSGLQAKGCPIAQVGLGRQRPRNKAIAS